RAARAASPRTDAPPPRAATWAGAPCPGASAWPGRRRAPLPASLHPPDDPGMLPGVRAVRLEGLVHRLPGEASDDGGGGNVRRNGEEKGRAVEEHAVPRVAGGPLGAEDHHPGVHAF